LTAEPLADRLGGRARQRAGPSFCGWLSVAAGLIELGRYVLALGIVIAAITYLSNWIDRRRPALVGRNSASGED